MRYHASSMERRTQSWQRYAVLALLLVVTLLYARTLSYGFAYDDTNQIVLNPRIESWQNVPSFFTQHLWAHRYASQFGNYYRPLFLVWMTANFSLFGLNSVGWHASSLLLELVCVLLLFRLARRLGATETVALLAAAMFALHPVTVESTAWISDADDLLWFALLLSALLAYLCVRETRSLRAEAGALGLFALALLAKETAIVLPGVVALHAMVFPENEDAPRGKKAWRALVAAVPFAGVAGAYLVARYFALGTMMHAANQASLATALRTLPLVLAMYLRNLVWPTRLALFYEDGYVAQITLQNFWVPLVIVVAGAMVTYLAVRRSRLGVFCIGSAVLLLAPAIAGISKFGDFGTVHDRYLYPALAFVAVAVALQITRIPKRLAVVDALLILAAFSLLTWRLQPSWRDNESLFARAVAVSPRASRPAVSLAEIRLAQNRTQEAQALVASALQNSPNLFVAQVLAATVAQREGDAAKEELYRMRAVALYPENAESHVLLARHRMRQGRDEEAVAEYRRGIALFPSRTDYRLELADLLVQDDRLEAALEQYRAVLELMPEENGLRTAIVRLEERIARKQGQ